MNYVHIFTYLVHNKCLRIPDCDTRIMGQNRLICICPHVDMDHAVHKHLLHSLAGPISIEHKTNIELLFGW